MDTNEKYLKEVSPQLRHAGFNVWPEYGGLLPVEWNGELLCRVRSSRKINGAY